MKKLLILFGFLVVLGVAPKVQAQCGSFGCMSTGYFFNAAAYTYIWNNASTSQKAAYSVDMAFSALFSSLAFIEQGKRQENYINNRRYNLENYKSVKRYYTEGIPPFASRGPNGRPRSPKITWADVQSID